MEDYFSFSLLSSPEHHMEAYKLRYQVYCRECHFIQEADYPAEFETDGFDKHSLHFGSFDSQNRLVGSVRLILPTCERFPVEEHCFNLEVDRSLIKRQECAEISRLTISKLYRRRANDGRIMSLRPRTRSLKIKEKFLGAGNGRWLSVYTGQCIANVSGGGFFIGLLSWKRAFGNF